jgi:hypothetical protein
MAGVHEKPNLLVAKEVNDARIRLRPDGHHCGIGSAAARRLIDRFTMYIAYLMGVLR